MNINNFGGTINYNDHHKEFTINGASSNISEIVRSFLSANIAPVEKVQPEDITPVPEYFKHITPKCIKENRVEAVEAEINAATKGTAEGLWRTLWDNENLGYVEVKHIDATTLYKDIENRFGELPFKERQFRSARNKRYV